MVLASIGLVVAVVAAWPRTEAPPPEGASVPGPSAVPSAGPGQIGRSDAGPAASVPGEDALPTRVWIDGVGIDARVRPVGVAADGQMEMPADPRVFGWYRFGPAPGADSGSVVVAGHLDSRRFGLGPLVRLRDVEVGETVRVGGSDGGTTTYRVVDVARYDRQGLPAEIFARSGEPRLRVVTCGGAYDPERGGYQQNLVVTAAPVPAG